MAQEETKAADKAAVDKAAADKAKESTKNKKPRTIVEKFHAAKKGNKQKVKFTASPTGVLNLGYHVGDEASFSGNQATMLVELKLAVKI